MLKIRKKNPFLGARLQPRDPAGHNRQVHVRLRMGCEQELENTVAALEVFAEAGAPIARQRFHGDVFPVDAPPAGTRRGAAAITTGPRVLG